MMQLNFPNYSFRIKNKENKRFIFDPIRKKFIILTPEEWVRQHVIQYLIESKNMSPALINVEKQLDLNGMKKRYDLVVFHPNGRIYLIVECKAPQVNITQATFDQIARYNLVSQSDYLMVTNGKSHYYCQMDYNNQRYNFLRELP